MVRLFSGEDRDGVHSKACNGVEKLKGGRTTAVPLQNADMKINAATVEIPVSMSIDGPGI
jgi:hypothetical protein